MIGITTGEFNEAFKSDNMQGMDFTPKSSSPSMLLFLATYIYYPKALQFKNASSVTDKYLVGQTVL